MIKWETFLNQPGVMTLLSLLMGFGIAAMFRPLCNSPDCMVIRGPPVNDVRGSVYQFGKQCVEFTPKAIACPKDGSVPVVDTVSFADYK
jgi:hypothetical protein